MYGITETTVHVTYRAGAGGGPRRGGSLIGQPIPDLAVHLLDRRLRPVPVGVPGEIYVGGAGLARGYLGRPGAHRRALRPRSRSARRRARGSTAPATSPAAAPDGELEYLGRIDQQVKIRGFRIELGEIEAALAAQPGVREAVVLAREDGLRRAPPGGLRGGGSRRPRRSAASLAERLPDYMLPAAFVFLDALPLTENGKIDRRRSPPRRRPAPRPPAASRPAIRWSVSSSINSATFWGCRPTARSGSTRISSRSAAPRSPARSSPIACRKPWGRSSTS